MIVKHLFEALDKSVALVKHLNRNKCFMYFLHIILLIIFSLFIYMSGTSADSTSVEKKVTLARLPPIADAWIDVDNPNANYGKSDRLTYKGNKGSWVLMKFDISNVETPKMVPLKAEIRLHSFDYLVWDEDTPLSIEVKYCRNDNWTEEKVTWNYFETYLHDYLSFGYIRIYNMTEYLSIDVTVFLPIAKEEGKKTLTIATYMWDPLNKTVSFDVASREYGYDDYEPILIISYTKPKTRISDMSIMSSSTIEEGEEVKVYGIVEFDGFLPPYPYSKYGIVPTIENAIVKLKYKPPSTFKWRERRVVTDLSGQFEDCFVPDEIGEWKVNATVIESETFDESETYQLTFEVTSPTPPTLSPTLQTQIDSLKTELANITNLMYVLILMTIFFIVVTIATTIYLVRKLKIKPEV